MNKNFDDGLKVIKAIRKKITNKSNKKYIILPSLQSTLYIINNLIKNDVIFGSQDCSQFKNGAFTGDISAEMIKKIGCKYILIGHSERRTIFEETDEVLKTKMKRALDEFVIEGVHTTIPFHKKLMCEEAFIKGDYTTNFMDSFEIS